MAIQSASEFEAVVAHNVIKVEKALNERGPVTSLENALRELAGLSRAARDSVKLKGLRASLEKTTDVLSAELPNEAGLLDQLWDLADYVDYRA